MKQKRVKRASDQTTMTISVPKALKARLTALAKEEKRSVSNYLTKELAEKYGDSQSQESPAASAR